MLLGLLLLPAPPCRAEGAPALDLLYIASAVDDAAGGHTAARLGETVFHYQYYPDGLFLLELDPWDDFRSRYNDEQNRSVTLTRVPLSRESSARIRSHFLQHYVLQEQRLRRLETLTEEVGLFQRLASGVDALSLEGLGFFPETGANDPHALALKESVVGRFGAAWLGEQLRAATSELEQLASRSAAPAGVILRLRELLSLREALVLLGDARSIGGDALRAADGNGGALTDQERTVVEEFLGELAESVLALLASNRPDRGPALLLQMARYQALRRSLETGVFATLDPFPEQTGPLPPAATVTGKVAGENRVREARAELLAFREAFVIATGVRSTAYSRIEAAQGRLSALERARQPGATARSGAGDALPRSSRAVRTGLQGTAGEFAQAARVAQANLDQSRKEVEQAYRYNLFTRNCVTEIVRAVNESFESREQQRAQLGGALEPGAGFSFIPFRLPAAVQTAFPLAESAFLPSYRLRQLELLYAESGPLVWLRENNTLTSTLYTPSWAEDSVFLFFTDDTVAARPLFGALNLLFAGTHAVGGLLLAPFDRGKLLTQSLRGMLYSLPEIAFFNIRKGSFAGVPGETPEQRP